MWHLLRVVMVVSLIVVAVGCSAIPSAFTDRIDKLIADNGAGTYDVTTTLSKDGKALVTVKEAWNCTNNAVQLTGCHQQGVTFEGPK